MLLCSPLNESKGNTRATNATVRLAQNGCFVYRTGGGERVAPTCKYLLFNKLYRCSVPAHRPYSRRPGGLSRTTDCGAAWTPGSTTNASSAPRQVSAQSFLLQARALFACGLLFPIFAHPGFPALARRRITSREGQCHDVGIRDLLPLVRIGRNHPNIPARGRGA